MASSENTQERLRVALVDRYRIEREIGSGGMATVYLAQDLKHPRQVAVKVLDPDLTQTSGAERFLREIETAAKLTHPHILPLIDSGEAGGFLYFVMPYVKGESLRDRISREGQLPLDDALKITREVAAALSYAHGQGVVHRDIKPENILLSAGEAVVADFGVAQAVAEAERGRLTQTGMSIGTPAYMSPEQAAGERDLDGRSDQYALACVLYEMLAGQPPFPGVHSETVVRQHLTADPPDVTRLRPTVPHGVAQALAKGMAKAPADRFKTTSDFGEVLGGHLHTPPKGMGTILGQDHGTTQPRSRQLTAIMFVDMVGYTALMREDEGRAKLLRDRMREVLEISLAEFEGEVLQYYGDGALCGLQSAVQAVQCAVAVQVGLRQEPPVSVRIGIHLGDVVHEATGVYGDGVNIASRVQALSCPGGILVSEKVADEVKNQAEISTRFLARVTLKSVQEPQGVFAVTNADLAVPSFKEVKRWPGVKGRGLRGRPGRAAAWTAGVLSLGALSLLVYSQLAEPEAPIQAVSIQETVAILPFDYQGREEDQWTGSGLASLLSGVLSGGVFIPVDHPSVRSLAESLEEQGLSGPRLFERVAREAGADLVIHGDLVGQPGGVFSANAYIFDPRTAGDVGRAFQESTDFSALAEGLASALLLERSDADPTLKHDLPTESFEALGAFIEGDREFQAGEYPQAMALFQEAVRIDPGFAIAHYRLSQAALWAWDWPAARQAADEAWRLVAELSDQNQRLLAAWQPFLRADPELAETRYQGLLEAFPQNVEVLAGLGSVLLYYNSLRGKRSQEAIPFFRRALEANPKYGEVRYIVLESAVQAGERAQFDRWHAGLNPESDQALAFEALEASRWGTPEDQERVRRRLDTATDLEVTYAVGRLAASLHDFSGARRVGELLLEPHRRQDLRFAAHGLFAALAFAQGKWTEAQLELDLTAQGEEAWALEMRAFLSLFDFIPVPEEDLRRLRDSVEVREPEAYESVTHRELFGPHSQYHEEFRAYLLGLLSARLGDLDAARDASGLIRSYARTEESRRLTYHLSEVSVRAHLEQARGNNEGALAILEGGEYFPQFEFIFASPFFSQALDRWLRASLLYDTGDLEKALDWYATLSDGWGEFLFAGPAHLRQAQICEELGRLPDAVAHYQQFERLWAEADPEFQPLLDQARAARERILSREGQD